ncbi:MAG: methyltransferase domain-containing protein [Gammaproteobacteria bacterium]
MNRSSHPAPAAYIHGYSEPEQARLIEQAAILAPAVFSGLDLSADRYLLEIGCGVGAETRHLLDRWPGLTIHGIDISEAQLSAARAYLGGDVAEGRVSLSRMDARSLALPDDRFDLAMTIWVLEHVPDPEAILRELLRVLRPGGRIILNEVNNNSFRFEPHNPVVQDWWEAFNAFQRDIGADPFIGQHLPAIARRVGFGEIHAEVVPAVSSLREPGRRAELLDYLGTLLMSAADAMRHSGRVSARQEAAMREELERAGSVPGLEFEYLAVRVTARKPL